MRTSKLEQIKHYSKTKPLLTIDEVAPLIGLSTRQARHVLEMAGTSWTELTGLCGRQRASLTGKQVDIKPKTITVPEVLTMPLTSGRMNYLNTDARI